MNILNKEELRRQIKEGKEISLDGILDEFKTLLRETIQTASEIELDAHLGYEKHQTSDNPNYRNGTNKKTLKSKYGDVDVAIPRDREGSFEPQLVKKRETLLNGTEDVILSLYTKGMSVRDIQDHLYSKTSNRSVIASMNEMKKHIESDLEMGKDIYDINKRLNTTPYKAIGYEYSVKLFSEMLKAK